jgi:hypothetical protein
MSMINTWEALITQSNMLLNLHKRLPTLHTLHQTHRESQHTGTGNGNMHVFDSSL